MSKIIAVHEDFNKNLEDYVKRLKEECELLGIPKRKITKVNATRLLARKITQAETNQKVAMDLLN